MPASVCSYKSIEQDEDLVRKIRRTPDAPIKPRVSGRYSSGVHNEDGTPRSTPRRRTLFLRRRNYSSSSSDLGDMSPLSTSEDSLHGTSMTTPTKRTPLNRSELSPKISSTLFPGSKPSVHGRPDKRNRTPRKGSRPRVLIEETPTSRFNETPKTSRRVLIPDDFEEDILAEESPKREEFEPVSPEDFYSAAKTPKTTLIVDNLVPKRINTSYVTGGSIKRKTNDNRSRSLSGSRSKGKSARSGIIPGVWHAIKKPKKLKKAPKPTISPKNRIQVTERKRSASQNLDLEPIAKRQKVEETPEKPKNPDSESKNLKRVATCTIFDNLRLEFNNGCMKLRSPPKKKKLVAAVRPLKKRPLPNEFDIDKKDSDEMENIHTRVEEILQEMDEEILPPKAVKVSQMTDEELINILESPNTKVKLVKTDLGEGFKQLAINDENSSSSLLATGEIVIGSTEILNRSVESENENKGTPDKSLYPVFYQDNWKNKSPKILTDISNVRRTRRKLMVPDDQYLLDAGQNSVAMVKCPQCEVIYQAGDFADEAAHNNHHNHLSELRFQGWTQERVLERFPDGRILQVVSTDPKPWLRKVAQILKIVDLELGFSEALFKWTPDKQVYLFISESGKQVAGCLVAEKCEKAYRMFPPVEGVEIDTCSRDPSPCEMGISRIWASLSHRRRKIATRLIDCARKDFPTDKKNLTADVLPLDMIAFSAPSMDGKALAQCFFKRYDFLVYGV